MTTVHRHLTVHGLVQGVGYRWSMVQAAERLGVQGWVRNRRDGTVEVFVSGDAAAVDALVAWAHRGPPDGRVERVDVVQAPAPDSAFEGFGARDTL
ncbi:MULTISPECIES: acylphosphatase [unclassified Variovorax]|uniref:acylphosphatase n=1 Tax=unclassified Variovorax TaxID=663243 RepID=UPI001BD1DC3B|nr:MULTISPECIES: acylphosphatase [unclassified Variovorax]